MRDWTGTRIRADALKLSCRACKAVVGAECTDRDGKPIVAFPAHACRMSDATKGEERSVAVGTPEGLKPPWRGTEPQESAAGGES